MTIKHITEAKAVAAGKALHDALSAKSTLAKKAGAEAALFKLDTVYAAGIKCGFIGLNKQPEMREAFWKAAEIAKSTKSEYNKIFDYGTKYEAIKKVATAVLPHKDTPSRLADIVKRGLTIVKESGKVPTQAGLVQGYTDKKAATKALHDVEKDRPKLTLRRKVEAIASKMLAKDGKPLLDMSGVYQAIDEAPEYVDGGDEAMPQTPEELLKRMADMQALLNKMNAGA